MDDIEIEYVNNKNSTCHLFILLPVWQMLVGIVLCQHLPPAVNTDADCQQPGEAAGKSINTIQFQTDGITFSWKLLEPSCLHTHSMFINNHILNADVGWQSLMGRLFSFSRSPLNDWSGASHVHRLILVRFGDITTAALVSTLGLPD